MKQIKGAVKIIKNSMYGSFNNVEYYCANCRKPISAFFLTTPLMCHNKGCELADMITKEELRDLKIDNIVNEQ